MATQADVRRIALSLPQTEQMEERFAFAVRTPVKPKKFAWVWRERIEPKKPRVPNAGVLSNGSASDRRARRKTRRK